MAQRLRCLRAQALRRAFSLGLTAAVLTGVPAPAAAAEPAPVPNAPLQASLPPQRQTLTPDPEETPEKTRVAAGARLMVGVQLLDESSDDSPDRKELELFLLQARVSARLRQSRRLKIKVSADLADGWQGPPREGDVSFLRDAKVELRLSPWLEVAAGRFKRPWSRLQLTSAGELPFRGRGLSAGLVAEDLSYGDRGVGFQLTTRLLGDEPALEASLAATTSRPQANLVDLHARLEWTFADGLVLGGSIVQKAARQENDSTESRWLGGKGYQLDVSVGRGRWEAVLDASWGEDLRYGNQAPASYSRRANAAGVAGYVAYRAPLADDTDLQPVAFAEWVDRDLAFQESEAVRVLVACNLLWNRSALRLMPQLELIRPRGRNAATEWPQRQTYSLLLSSEI